MICIEPLRTTSTSAVKAAEQSKFCHLAFKLAKDYVTESGWQGLAGFRGPQQNPSELSESVYLQIFATETFFTIAGKQAICGCQKTYTHARSLKGVWTKLLPYSNFYLEVYAP